MKPILPASAGSALAVVGRAREAVLQGAGTVRDGAQRERGAGRADVDGRRRDTVYASCARIPSRTSIIFSWTSSFPFEVGWLANEEGEWTSRPAGMGREMEWSPP